MKRFCIVVKSFMRGVAFCFLRDTGEGFNLQSCSARQIQNNEPHLLKFFAVVKYSRIVEVINFTSIFPECKLEIP